MTSLRIAVPNKGSLAATTDEMLREAGYRTRRDGKELVVRDDDNGVEIFYLRPRDVAVYVGSGTVDLGVTGRDLLIDSASDAIELARLGFGESTFRFAALPGGPTSLTALTGKRIATSYPTLVEHHLAGAGITATVVRLDGAVETAIMLGVADAIADVVQTGTTLRNQGLVTFGEPLMESEAILIGRPGEEAPAAKVLRRRLDGVLAARLYVMIEYDIETNFVGQAVRITPGLESPTVSPLDNPGWVAVRAMVPRAHTNGVMDELYDLGARAIVVTAIQACRI
ncbi:MAG: ATP phosphoribosyltransferase [Microthrixaceae bacterium]